MKVKLGWKRNLVKIVHLFAVFYFGLFAWALLSGLFNIDPKKITFIPVILIAIGWGLLAIVHKKKDFNILADKVLKETGIDPRSIIKREVKNSEVKGEKQD